MASYQQNSIMNIIILSSSRRGREPDDHIAPNHVVTVALKVTAGPQFSTTCNSALDSNRKLYKVT